MPDIFASITNGTVTIGNYLICTAVALICGIAAAAAASYRSHISKSFLVCLILLPAVVETVIVMVNGNIGTGIAVAGAFSLVRFRSVAGKAKEIVSIFFVMTAGLACAAGYVGIAVVFTVIVCAVMLLVMSIRIPGEKMTELHITVPETQNFSGAFDDLFDEYTNSRKLLSVKTSNMGSLYKLLYRIELKNADSAKAFIDELRCRNGNLEISIMEAAERSEEL